MGQLCGPGGLGVLDGSPVERLRFGPREPGWETDVVLLEVKAG